MQNTVRTTIRIRKDLLEQSRSIAHSKKTSVQDVVNETLAIGFKHVTDMTTSKDAMLQIDSFRNKLNKKQIDLQKIIMVSKRDLK